MARCYSETMRKRQPSLNNRRPRAMPEIWIVSDARNDHVLEDALKRAPRGSGLIFRHYHLPARDRRLRFEALGRLARSRGQFIALAGSAAEARSWGADGAYGSSRQLSKGPALPRLITAHCLREIRHANRARASAILLSPVFPTRSHPGEHGIGPIRFRLMSRRTDVPVIALGGMNVRLAKRLKTVRWAAIDSFLA